MKRILPIIFAATLFFASGCGRKNKFQAPPPPEVTVEHPVQKDTTIYLSFSGRLVATDSVEIRARVKGFLKSIDFADGQRVEKGDLLFTIEPEKYEAVVELAEAEVAQAEASLKLADATLQRIERAYKTKAVSELDLLSAEAEKQSAEAAVMAAKAKLNDVELDLSYTQICAPMAGRLSRRILSVGNLVGDGGSTLLTTLVVEAPIDAYFNVDERTLIPFLQAGVKDSKRKSDIPLVKLELADGSLHGEEGILNYVDPEIDPDTGTVHVRAVFPNKGEELLPGLFGKILIPRLIKDAVLIPELSIQHDMSGFYVLVVATGNKVERRAIERGAQTGPLRIIQKGLAAEDQIITEGIQRARPGIEVTLSSSTASTVAD